MSHEAGRVYFDRSSELAAPYRPGDDPRVLQVAFGRLFDEAATAVYLAGSDLDEVLIERLLVARDSMNIIELSAKFLADAESLKTSLKAQLMQKNPPADISLLEIVAVRIVVRHDAPSFR